MSLYISLVFMYIQRIFVNNAKFYSFCVDFSFLWQYNFCMLYKRNLEE